MRDSFIKILLNNLLQYIELYMIIIIDFRGYIAQKPKATSKRSLYVTGK